MWDIGKKEWYTNKARGASQKHGMVTTLLTSRGEKTTRVGEKRQDTSAIQGMIQIDGRNPSPVDI